MADYYEHFSWLVPLNPRDATATLKLLTRLREIDDSINTADSPAPDAPTFTAPDVPEQLLKLLAEDSPYGFNAEVTPEGLWISSEDQGLSEFLLGFLQYLLATYAPDQRLGLSWACTCSKPRLDGFGGGACVLTATTRETFTTFDWLLDRGLI